MVLEPHRGGKKPQNKKKTQNISKKKISPSEKIEAPHVSVAEGATVDAGISTILLTYSKPVSLNPSESVTLNDAAVSASVNAEDRCIVELSVALAHGTAYTLVVP